MSVDEIDPDAQSPWWPCPDCGDIHFHTTVTFERGGWVQYMPEEHVWQAFDPPTGRPTGTALDVRCDGCGHEFNIAKHYDWPIAGERE